MNYDDLVKAVFEASPQSKIDIAHIIEFVGWGITKGIFGPIDAGKIVGAYQQFAEIQKSPPPPTD